LSPDGQYAIDGTLYSCNLIDFATKDVIVADGGCGFEDWTRDSKFAVTWDLCSGPEDAARCVAGRAIDPQKIPPTPTTEADATRAAEDVYVEGPVCDPDAPPSSPLVPSNLPAPEFGASTPDYYAVLLQFYESTSKVIYRVCDETSFRDSEHREFELTWVKEGTSRARFEMPAILPADQKAFDFVHVFDGGAAYTCGERIGRYLETVFQPIDSSSYRDEPDPWFEAAEDYFGAENRCFRDDSGAIFLDRPFQVFDDALGSTGIDDPREADLSTLRAGDPSDWGTYWNIGTRNIAGIEATCFRVPGFDDSERCFSEDGALLFAQSQTRIEAISVESAGESDFELPFDVEAEIPRCFPREDPTPRPTFDVQERIERRDFESALSTALLQATDLSCEWRDGAEFAPGGDSRECGDASDVEVLDSMARAQVYLAKVSDFGGEEYPEELLRHRLYYVADDDPVEIVGALRAYFADCSGSSFENDDGEVVTMSLEAVPVEDPLGEESAAFYATYNHPSYPHVFILYWVEGRLLSSLSLIVYRPGPDPSFAREFSPSLLERMASDLQPGIADLSEQFRNQN
jgi:hypothetical protein